MCVKSEEEGPGEKIFWLGLQCLSLFVGRMYSLEHNNMTAAPVIKGNTSGFLPTGASLSISKWRLREIGVYLVNPTYSTSGGQ